MPEDDDLTKKADESVSLVTSGAVDVEREKRAAELSYNLGITIDQARQYDAHMPAGVKPDVYKVTPTVKRWLADQNNAALSIDDIPAIQEAEHKADLARMYPEQESRWFETAARAMATAPGKFLANAANLGSFGAEAQSQVLDWFTGGQIRKAVFGDDSPWAYAPSDLSRQLEEATGFKSFKSSATYASDWWAQVKGDTEQAVMGPVADWQTTIPFTNISYSPANVASGVAQLGADLPFMYAFGPLVSTVGMRAPDYERAADDAGLDGVNKEAYVAIRSSVDGVLNHMFRGILDGQFDKFATVTVGQMTRYLAKQMTVDQGKEQGEEYLANLFGNLADQVFLPENEDKPLLQVLQDTLDNTNDEAVETALTVLVGQGAVASAHTAMQTPSMLAQAEVTRRQRSMLKAVAEDVQKMNIHQQSRPKSIALAQMLARGHTTMSLDTAKAMELAQQDDAVSKGLKDAGFDLVELGKQAEQNQEIVIDAANIIVGMPPETAATFLDQALAATPGVALVNQTIDTEEKGEPIEQVERSPEEVAARKEVARIVREVKKAGRPVEESRAIGVMLSKYLDFEIANGANPAEVMERLKITRATPERMESQWQLLQAAFHGTGNTQPYDAFKTGAVGGVGGEGAQAFGWGLYFSGSQGIAEGYRKKLSNPGPSLDGASWKGSTVGAIDDRTAEQKAKDQAWFAVHSSRGDVKAAINSLRSSNLGAAATWLDKNADRVGWGSGEGRLYQVDIPESDQLLQWDEPLSEQTDMLESAVRLIVGEEVIDEIIEQAYEDAAYGVDVEEMVHSFLTSNDGDTNTNLESDLGEEAAARLRAIKRDAFDFDLGFDTGESFYLHLSATFGGDRQASQWLNENLNIPGLEYPAGSITGVDSDARNYVIWTDDAIEIQSFEQRNERDAKGAVNIADEGTLIGLFDGADASTVVHELGHVFFERMRFHAESADALETTQRDWVAVSAWTAALDDDKEMRSQYDKYISGRYDGRAWDSLNDAEQAQARQIAKHEYFARGFEAWLMEGKAPQPELNGAFTRFAQWLKRVYQSVSALDVTLSDDVRQVFGRLFMTDADVQELDIASGMSDFDADYLRSLKVPEKRIPELLALLEGATHEHYISLYSQRTKAARQNHKNWQTEARIEVDARPVYTHIKDIRAAGGLDYQKLVDAIGKSGVADLRKSHSGMVAKVGDAGLDPLSVSMANGYSSPIEMSKTLTDTPTRNKAVKQEYENRAVNGDTAFGSVDALLKSEGYSAFLDEVGRYITKLNTGKGSVSNTPEIEALREFNQATAREALGGNQYLAQARRSFAKERDAVKAGDLGEAYTQNAIGRKAIEKAKLASELRDFTRKAVNKSKRAVRAKPGTVELQHLSYMIVYGKRFGVLSEKVKDPDPEWLKQTEVEGGVNLDANDIIPEWMKTAPESHYKDLTAEQWREAAATIGRLDDVGRMVIRRNKELLGLDQDILVMDLTQEAEQRKDAKHRPRVDRNSVRGRVREYFSSIKKFRYDLIDIDGGTNLGPGSTDGIWERTVFSPIAMADQRYWRLYKQTNDQLADPVSALTAWIKKQPHSVADIKIVYPEALTKSAHRSTSWSPEEIVSLALNMGNADNIARMQAGLGLTDSDLGTLRAYLPPEVWQACQGVWDGLESLWPHISNQMFSMYGYRPRKIDAAPSAFESHGKTVELRGGYYPMSPDPAERTRGREIERIEELGKQGMNSVISPQKGFTMDRTDQITGYLPRLSLSLINNHVEYAVTFAAKGKVIQDINRLFKRKDVAQVYTDKLGEDAYDRVDSWLRAQLNLDKQELNWIDKLVGKSMSLGASWLMGFNWNTVMNSGLGGVAEMLSEYGTTNYIGGSVKFMQSAANDFPAMWQVIQSSNLMHDRFANRYLELEKFSKEATKDLTKKAGDWQDKLVGISLMGVSFGGMMAEMPVWWDIYTNELDSHGDQEQAIVAADSYIRKIAPTSLKGDLSELQRSRKAFDKLVYPINSYVNLTYNVWRSAIRSWQEGGMSTTQAMKYLFMRSIVASNVVTAMALLGAFMSDDEEEIKKNLARMGSNSLQFPTQGMPIVSTGMRYAVDTVIDGDPYVPSHPYSRIRRPAYNTLENMIKLVTNTTGATDYDYTSEALKDAARTIGYTIGVPWENVYRQFLEEEKKRK